MNYFDKRKMVVIIMLFTLVFFMSGCLDPKIKGKDIEKTFVRSNNYSVEYGTETHFEMGTLLSEGSHIVCDDYSYYTDGFAMYLKNESATTTFVQIGDEFYLLDMPSSKILPTYDIDVLESYLFGNDYKKSIISTRYSYKNNDFVIKFREINTDLVYEINLLNEGIIYRFNNNIEPNECNVNLNDSTTISLSDFVLAKFDEIHNNKEFTIETVEYNASSDTITINMVDDIVVFHLNSNKIDFYIGEDIEYSYHSDTLQYSWTGGPYVTGPMPPSFITIDINYHDYHDFIKLYKAYQAIFFGGEHYINIYE